MKSEGKIRHKLKQVHHRIIQKEIRKSSSKKPCNCKYSGLVRGASSDPLFYVCLLDADKRDVWEGLICDSSVPNTCPFFTPFKSEEDVKSEVLSILQSGDMGKIATHYPDAAALLWVLAGVEETEEENGNKNEEQDEPSNQDPLEEQNKPTDPEQEPPNS